MLDNTSMIRYQNEYDNHRVPSAPIFLKRFDCAWADVLLKIDIRYGKKRAVGLLLLRGLILVRMRRCVFRRSINQKSTKNL